MKHINRIVFCVLVVAAFVLGACSVGTVNAEQNRPLKIWYENKNSYTHTWKVVDDNTVVNYVVVTTERGNGAMSIAITPRLNSDGTLYVEDD